jgi:hypothetical protein
MYVQSERMYKCLGETETNDHNRLAKIGLKSLREENRSFDNITSVTNHQIFCD